MGVNLALQHIILMMLIVLCIVKQQGFWKILFILSSVEIITAFIEEKTQAWICWSRLFLDEKSKITRD